MSCSSLGRAGVNTILHVQPEVQLSTLFSTRAYDLNDPALVVVFVSGDIPILMGCVPHFPLNLFLFIIIPFA